MSPSAAGRAHASLTSRLVALDAFARLALAFARVQRAAIIADGAACAPGRVNQRSSCKPPGCRCPAVPSSSMSRSAVNMLRWRPPG